MSSSDDQAQAKIRGARERMPPFNFGGEMIRKVTVEETTWNDTLLRWCWLAPLSLYKVKSCEFETESEAAMTIRDEILSANERSVLLPTTGVEACPAPYALADDPVA